MCKIIGKIIGPSHGSQGILHMCEVPVSLWYNRISCAWWSAAAAEHHRWPWPSSFCLPCILPWLVSPFSTSKVSIILCKDVHWFFRTRQQCWTWICHHCSRSTHHSKLPPMFWQSTSIHLVIDQVPILNGLLNIQVTLLYLMFQGTDPVLNLWLQPFIISICHSHQSYMHWTWFHFSCVHGFGKESCTIRGYVSHLKTAVTIRDTRYCSHAALCRISHCSPWFTKQVSSITNEAHKIAALHCQYLITN